MLACTQELFYKGDASLRGAVASGPGTMPTMFEAKDDRAKKKSHVITPPQTDKEKEEQVWPPEVESAFIEALKTIPKLGRRKILVNGKPCGRNELISDFIFRKTSKIRTRKQVSSHIQVLKNTRKGDPQFMRLLTDSVDMDDEMQQRKSKSTSGENGSNGTSQARKRHAFPPQQQQQQQQPQAHHAHGHSSHGMMHHSGAGVVHALQKPVASLGTANGGSFINPMTKFNLLSNSSLSSDESSINSSPSPADYVFDIMYGAHGHGTNVHGGSEHAHHAFSQQHAHHHLPHASSASSTGAAATAAAGGGHSLPLSSSYSSHHVSMIDMKDPFYDIAFTSPLLDMDVITQPQLTNVAVAACSSSSSTSSILSTASSQPHSHQQHHSSAAAHHPHHHHHHHHAHAPSSYDLIMDYQPTGPNAVTNGAQDTTNALDLMMDASSWLPDASASPSTGPKPSTSSSASLMMPLTLNTSDAACNNTDMYGLPSTPGLTTPIHEHAPDMKNASSPLHLMIPPNGAGTPGPQQQLHHSHAHQAPSQAQLQQSQQMVTPPIPTSQKWKRAKRKAAKAAARSRKHQHHHHHNVPALEMPAELLPHLHPSLPMTPIPSPSHETALWPNYICLYLEFPVNYHPSALSSHTLAQLPHCIPSSTTSSSTSGLDQLNNKCASLIDAHPILNNLSSDVILLAKMKLDLGFSSDEFFFNNTCFFESKERRMIECTMTIYSFGNVVLESKEIQQALWIHEGKYMYSFVYVNQFFDAFMKGVRSLQTWEDVDVAIHNLCIVQVFEEIDAPVDGKVAAGGATDVNAAASAKRTPLLAMIYGFERGHGSIDLTTIQSLKDEPMDTMSPSSQAHAPPSSTSTAR
ncbi:TEA/ATTS domain family-domain-containing protein [Gongronella butleri]|nr:TEA/ATTS domain family-domain-containing protein [Gongronella butleri]